MAGHAAVGTVSYNGYTFEGAYEATCVQRPVRDEADRTAVYTEYQITVKAIIQANAGTGATLEVLRILLSKDGMPLRFINNGYGSSLSVNIPGGKRDLRWGPKPRFLSWDPIGSSQACEVTWQCTTAVEACASPPGWKIDGRLIAFNYTVGFSHDNKGFTRRVINGHAIIAQSHDPALPFRVKKSADEIWDRIFGLFAGEPPEKFERQTSRTVSQDKSRLDFTITDSEIQSPIPYPEHAAAINAEQMTTWRRGRRGSLFYYSTLSMDVTRSSKVKGEAAWVMFRSLLVDRMQEAGRGKHAAFLQELMVRENIFGPNASFRAVWRMLSSMDDFIKDAGLWKRPKGLDWGKWRKSIKYDQSPRGRAGLEHFGSMDVIVNVCNPAYPSMRQKPKKQKEKKTEQKSFKNKKPKRNRSYLDYQMDIGVGRSRPVARQSYLQGADVHYQGSVGDQNQGSVGDQMLSSAAPGWGPVGGVSDTLQVGGRSRYEILLSGRAVRAAYDIPRPAVLTVNGMSVEEVGGAFQMRTLGNFFGVAVYVAEWALRYLVPNSVGKVIPAYNWQEEAG